VSVTIFGVLVVAIGIWCQCGSYRRAVITMVALTVFGSAGALELSALGGASVTPADLFILFYSLRLLSMRQGTGMLIAEIAPSRPLFIFVLLNLWICGAALVTPRLFDSATYVFSLSRTVDADGMTLLHPTSGNISQVVYAMGGFVVACVTSAYARRPGGLAALLEALVVVTWLDLGFAILDLVTSATHTGFILDLVHTANYAFLTDDELGGVKRISGSFSEASAFASFSLTMLGVNFPLYVMKVRPRFTGPASALLAGLIALSTSSAGYAGLGVFVLGFMIYVAATTLISLRRRPLAIAATMVAAGIFVAACVFLFLPAVAKTVQAILTESLFNKGSSDSALERGSWNRQGWQVFLDTYGVGAGIGTTRTSSYIVLLLSNLGALGFVLFFTLIARLVLSRVAPWLPHEDRALVWAARIGILLSLVASFLVGTVYYLGPLFYILLGVAASGVASNAVAAMKPPAMALGSRHTA
jgi:hypothetical protein